MKIAITTDSSSGLTSEEAEKLGVYVMPMPFYIGDETYYESVNLFQNEFYEKLKSDVDVATSQPIVAQLLEFWEKLLKDYDELVYIPISSGLSQSWSTAQALSKEYGGRIHVVNNQRVSVTLRQSVCDAVKLKAMGKTGEEIKDYLEKTKLDSSIYIMVDTMKYLKKGGRVTPAAAAVGSLLKLKPVLQIQGEKLDKFAVARTVGKAKEAMINAVRSDLYGRFYDYTKNGEMVLSFAHTDNSEELEKFIGEARTAFPDLPFAFADPLSLAVACHIGPGSLAMALSRTVK